MIRRNHRKSLLSSVLALAMMGLLAGAIGGLGVGLISKGGSSPSSAAH